MTLRELVEAAHLNSRIHGFWNDVPNIPEKLALIHSEVSEALEAFRSGSMDEYVTEAGKPEGFGTELADTIIRIADLVGYLDIDIEKLVAAKMRYNSTRPYKHGKVI